VRFTVGADRYPAGDAVDVGVAVVVTVAVVV
jgi:hypothetical protein